MRLALDEWTDLDLGKTRTRLDLPDDQAYPGFWLQLEGTASVRVEMIAADDGSDPDQAVSVRQVPFEVRVRRGEVAVSADRRTKVRVRVVTREGRA